MTSTFVATVAPFRCRKQALYNPSCVLHASVCAPAAPMRRGEAQGCCCQAEPPSTDARVQTVRTYDENKGRIYSAQPESEDDEDGSIASLVPGGLKSQRSRRGGAVEAEARRERSRPLKINTDLKLYRARRKRMASTCTPPGTRRDHMDKQTEEELRAVLALDPTDERTYVILGTLLLRQKRVDEARRVYEEGCTVAQGSNAYIWTAIGNLEKREGNLRKARKCFEAAIVACDTHAAAYHGWGQLELTERRFDAAKQVLLKGVKMTYSDPNPHLYAALANLAMKTGLVGEARYWLREGTNTPKGSKSNALWCTWGNLEWKEVGDVQAASYCFDMALRVYPRSRYALLSLGLMEKANGNIERAKELLARGAKFNPTDAALRQAHGMMLMEEKKYSAARNQFKAGSRANPSHLPVWQAWAVMEGNLGRFDEARTLFQRGVWAAPKSTDLVYLWQAWGVMEARAGNLVAARSLFKTAVRLDPRNDACWEAWIRMEEQSDLLERANGLRVARFEAETSNSVPESFSTMPDSAGPVVKKWMSQFISTQAPSEVYTPPPGRDPLSSSDPAQSPPGQGGSAQPPAQSNAAPEATPDTQASTSAAAASASSDSSTQKTKAQQPRQPVESKTPQSEAVATGTTATESEPSGSRPTSRPPTMRRPDQGLLNGYIQTPPVATARAEDSNSSQSTTDGPAGSRKAASKAKRPRSKVAGGTVSRLQPPPTPNDAKADSSASARKAASATASTACVVSPRTPDTSTSLVTPDTNGGGTVPPGGASDAADATTSTTTRSKRKLAASLHNVVNAEESAPVATIAARSRVDVNVNPAASSVRARSSGSSVANLERPAVNPTATVNPASAEVDGNRRGAAPSSSPGVKAPEQRRAVSKAVSKADVSSANVAAAALDSVSESKSDSDSSCSGAISEAAAEDGAQLEVQLERRARAVGSSDGSSSGSAATNGGSSGGEGGRGKGEGGQEGVEPEEVVAAARAG